MHTPYIPKIEVTELLKKSVTEDFEKQNERCYAVCPCCGTCIGLYRYRGYPQKQVFNTVDDCIQWLISMRGKANG